MAQPNFLGDFIGRAANDHAGARFDETPRPVVVEGVPGRVELRGSVGSFETGRTLPLAGDGDPPDIPGMTVTRDEMNARLEAVESRLDGKVAQVGADVRVLSGKMDALATQMAEFRTTMAANAQAIQADVADLRKESRDERRATRSLFVGSGLAVVTIILGTLYAIVQTQHSIGSMMQSAVANVVSALQTGIVIGEAVRPPK